jgi:hypothetical protein
VADSHHRLQATAVGLGLQETYLSGVEHNGVESSTVAPNIPPFGKPSPRFGQCEKEQCNDSSLAAV